MEFIFKENNRNITNEEMLNDLRNVAKLLNSECVSTDDYNKYGKFAVSTISRRFGSFPKAIEIARLKLTKNQLSRIVVCENDLKEDLLRVYKLNGQKSFSYVFYNEYGKYGYKRQCKFFGNWENALRSVGIIVKGGSKHISDTMLLEDIEIMWEKKGSQPTTNDVKQGKTKYSLNTFCRRFGSWNNALHTFVEYVNSENSAISHDTKTKEIQTNELIYKHKTSREINLRLRFLVMKRDDFKCCICGRSPATTSGLVLQIDHIKPWAKGGETVLENLQTLCSDCNLGKSDIE